MNIVVTCAHCGEELDTNEAERDEIIGGVLIMDGMELHVGDHECFQDTKGEPNNDVEDIRRQNLLRDRS